VEKNSSERETLSSLFIVQVVIIQEDSDGSISITDDYQSNRVRLFVDEDRMVFMIPSLG